MMTRDIRVRGALAALTIASTLLLPAFAGAEDAAKKKGASSADQANLDAKAVEVLKAMSGRLISAKSMSFDVVSTYETPGTSGSPLTYKTVSQVSLQRPDKLYVLTPADGPATEFLYNGKTMTMLASADNVAATSDAPKTVDAALDKLRASGIEFPFGDFLASDPYAAMSKTMSSASYLGQSRVVGGIITDMVAYQTAGSYNEVWIGSDDKLPRLARKVLLSDPQRLRREVELFNWKLNFALKPETFASAKAAAAQKVELGDPKLHSWPLVAAPAAPAPKPQ